MSVVFATPQSAKRWRNLIHKMSCIWVNLLQLDSGVLGLHH
ncbi:MAG: hypothetical protein ACJ0BG_06905 [Dehalococcoidia bacterium]